MFVLIFFYFVIDILSEFQLTLAERADTIEPMS